MVRVIASSSWSNFWRVAHEREAFGRLRTEAFRALERPLDTVASIEWLARKRFDLKNKERDRSNAKRIELENVERSYKTGPTETWVLRRIGLMTEEKER
jgi:hypothetical protein